MDKLKLADRIGKLIDFTCEEKYADGPRTHLGASLIGHSCSRYLWYTFRWVFHKKHNGRMQRLFNRGHKEEERIVEWLRDGGFEVREFDEDGNQFRISDCGGHFGGSTDGEVKLPGQLANEFDYHNWLLLEMKTYNDASFRRLEKNGMVREKPQHNSQMCTYGVKKGYKYGLYVAINKNTDAIYIEIVELDKEHGLECLSRAEEIINTALPPQKLSQSPTHFKCTYCDFFGVCHGDKLPDINCRSCKHAEPMDNKEWKCNLYNKTIPKDHIGIGCGQWVNIQEL